MLRELSSAVEKGWARRMVVAALMTALALGSLQAAKIVVRDSNAETRAFDSVYYAALLSGRDPDAALRKAHYTADNLVKAFGMTRTEAAAEVVKFTILRTPGLCGG